MRSSKHATSGINPFEARLAGRAFFLDSGGVSFNFSEIVGNGMEAGLANLYCPAQERGFRKTGENWAIQLEVASLNNIIREFWPDIRHKILRQK